MNIISSRFFVFLFMVLVFNIAFFLGSCVGDWEVEVVSRGFVRMAGYGGCEGVFRS